MQIALLVPIVMCLGVGFGLCLLIRNTAAAGGSLPVTPEWIDELSVERYRPMMRLLDGKDLEFLRSQPGFTPKMANKLRVQRCQIFRGYLRCLHNDFGRVCAAIRILMMHSRYDRPDLARILFHQQAMFAAAMMMVQFRLFLYRWGVCSVEVGSLVKIFEGMRLELRTLVPAALPMGA
jgi:hypothetical protein